MVDQELLESSLLFTCLIHSIPLQPWEYVRFQVWTTYSTWFCHYLVQFVAKLVVVSLVDCSVVFVSKNGPFSMLFNIDLLQSICLFVIFCLDIHLRCDRQI